MLACCEREDPLADSVIKPDVSAIKRRRLGGEAVAGARGFRHRAGAGESHSPERWVMRRTTCGGFAVICRRLSRYAPRSSLPNGQMARSNVVTIGRGGGEGVRCDDVLACAARRTPATFRRRALFRYGKGGADGVGFGLGPIPRNMRPPPAWLLPPLSVHRPCIARRVRTDFGCAALSHVHS